MPSTHLRGDCDAKRYEASARAAKSACVIHNRNASDQLAGYGGDTKQSKRDDGESAVQWMSNRFVAERCTRYSHDHQMECGSFSARRDCETCPESQPSNVLLVRDSVRARCLHVGYSQVPSESVHEYQQHKATQPRPLKSRLRASRGLHTSKPVSGFGVVREDLLPGKLQREWGRR